MSRVATLLCVLGAGTLTTAPAAQAAPYLDTVLASSPSLYWRYGELAGTVINDASGQGHSGEYVINNFVNDGVELGRPGALANDGNTAFGKSGTYHYYGATFARAATAGGLPQGDAPRTVECWVKFNNTVVLARYGGFSVTATSRAIAITTGVGNVSLPVADLALTDGRWHHVVVTYDSSHFTGYVDGNEIGGVARPAAMTTSTTGGFEAGVIPTGQSNGYFDELAIYPAALSALQVRQNFAASGNAIPGAPPNVQATVSAAQPNRIAVSWSPAAAGAPPAQSPVEHYVVTAYAGSQARGSKSVAGSATQAVLSGLPGDVDYTVKVHATNGFGVGPDGESAPVRTGGASDTYLSSVLASGPALLWRYGEPSGSRIADSSGRGHDGEYVLDNFVNDGVDLNRSGALANDPDTAFGKSGTYHYYGATFARSLKAAGLPAGDAGRSVESWLRFSNTVVLARYGSFSVTATSRAISITTGAGDVSIAVADMSLTDGRWHHVVVTYDGSRFTGYVDGAEVGSVARPAPLTTSTAGGFEAGVIPTGLSNGYFDELAIYPGALSAARVRGHFVASGNSLPSAPADLQVVATQSQRNRISVSWSPASGGAPADQRSIEHYVVTAYAGSQARGSKAVFGSQTQAVISGLPGDRDYTVKVHATNGFGVGPDAESAPVRVHGANETYASSVLASGAALYWRYGEPSGSRIADSSGNGHDGEYVLDNFVNDGVDLNRPGALTNDTDTAFGKAGTYHYYGATFARSLKAAGLPAGDAPRTVEAWLKFSNTVVLARYGGFSITATSGVLTIATGSRSLVIGTAPVSLTDGAWHHVAVSYDGTRFTAYVDGSETGSVVNPDAMTTSTAGGFEAGIVPTGLSSGYFDELAIYPSSLTAAQIRNHLRADQDAIAVGDGGGEESVVRTIEGPTRIRRGRANRFWIAIQNRGPSTVHGTTGTLRLPDGITYDVVDPATNPCAALLDEVQRRGGTVDRASVLASPACTPAGPQTTTAPRSLLFRVERLEPGQVVRIPIDITANANGPVPMTLSAAVADSPYSSSGSSADFARDPIVHALARPQLAAAGVDPGSEAERTVVETLDDILQSVGVPWFLSDPTTPSGFGMYLGAAMVVAGAILTAPLLVEAGVAVMAAGVALGIALALGDLWNFLTESLFSMDPNDKLGPNGSGAERWIAAGSSMPYVIRFENDPARATAPAQLVEISDTLSPDLDAATLQFQEVVVAGIAIPLSAGAGGLYSGTYDPPGAAAPIRAEARYDAGSRKVSFRIFGVGGGTGQDQYTDFLPLNTTSPEGEGYVTFLIRSKPATPHGTVIRNLATITFDSHEGGGSSLDTPAIENTIDVTPPASSIGALPGESPRRFKVDWSGSDAGSGVRSYTVYVSRDGGSLERWLSATDGAEGTFEGQPGSSYGFVVQARDHTGNLEALKGAVEESTTVGPDPPPAQEPPPAATPAGGGGASEPPAVSARPRESAKLAVTRNLIDRRRRVLEVVALISSSASGQIDVEFSSVGRRVRFKGAIEPKRSRMHLRAPLTAAQAKLGSGTVTLRYRGDEDTRPQTVQLRAASNPARLVARRPTLVGGRLKASGTISRKARGVVRVTLEYDFDGGPRTLSLSAPIRNGIWTVNTKLSAGAMSEITGRSGELHSSMLFTGYSPQRIGGELRSVGVLGPP